MTDFDTLFQPVITSRGLEQRPQQRHLGWAIMDSFEREVNLVGEARTGTGKSYAYLVPLIHHARKKTRSVVSTETTALQDQLFNKDLPALHQIYHGGFSFYSLKGRSWYYCESRAKLNGRLNPDVQRIIAAMSPRLEHGLKTGEQADCERVLGEKILPETWQLVNGNPEHCAENKCTADRCLSSRARQRAQAADIVVTNHAMLMTDGDMRVDGNDGIIGDYDLLVVDEAHTLERVLVDGWSTSVTGWDISQLEGAVMDGLSRCQTVISVDSKLPPAVSAGFELLDRALATVTNVFYRLHQRASGSSDTWNRQNFPLAEVVLTGSPQPLLVDAVDRYEAVPRTLELLDEVVGRALKTLVDGLAECEDRRVSGVRKIRKGARAARELHNLIELINAAVKTRDGIVMRFGVPYGVVVHGLVKRDGSRSVRLTATPLDVSKRCEETLWRDKTVALVSATLLDPTTQTFDYTVKSLGLLDYQTVTVTSPFEYRKQQLVYVTPGERPPVDVGGAWYSFDELVEVIHHVDGRALVLFTARAELDDAYARLSAMQASGAFKYPIYYQDKTSSKQDLVTQFTQDHHSVLLGTKSFFTGVDFPGATCSAVIMCKFPLPQFNSLCRQQIAWWRRRGFPQWYEREALTIFSQAAGRLIRSETDHGVVAVLDQRCAMPRHQVYRTAQVGISATGSNVTSSISDVEQFLSQRKVGSLP